MQTLRYKLLKFFSFNGRISRFEYASSVALVILLFAFIEEFRLNQDYLTLTIFFTPILWFLFAQGAKRCHDMGISGWWQIIPYYFATMLFLGGDQQANEYGDPL